MRVFSPSTCVTAEKCWILLHQEMLVRLLTIALYPWAASTLSLPPNARLVPNVSSIEFHSAVSPNASPILVENSDCFTDRRLLPTSFQDCYKAANALLDGIKYPLRPRVFARKGHVGFKLPKVVRNGTCVISLDVANDDDRDNFQPVVAFTTALNLADECLGTNYHLGGKRTIGPRRVVEVMVFGRERPVEDGNEADSRALRLKTSNTMIVDGGKIDRNASEISGTTSLGGGRRIAGPRDLLKVSIAGMASSELVAVRTAADSAHAVTRTRAISKSPKISDTSSVSSDVRMLGSLASVGNSIFNTSALTSNRSLAGITTSLKGALTCYDPPLPREILYPYVASDCDKASDQIIGDRNRWMTYIFSRKHSTSPDWYQLPARITYRSCVIFLDMNNDKDEDPVRVNYVASSAWVLARKCSGEDDTEHRYGGFMTVSVGAADLISINVYGRPWPPLTRQSSTLVLSQSTPSVARE